MRYKIFTKGEYVYAEVVVWLRPALESAFPDWNNGIWQDAFFSQKRTQQFTRIRSHQLRNWYLICKDLSTEIDR